MTPDDPTQAIESTEENRAEAGPSRSRRGFLRKIAATGILGMSGLTAVVASSEPASAGGWNRGPITMSAGEKRTFGNNNDIRNTGEIRIEGVANYSDYHVWGPRLREAGNAGEGTGSKNKGGRVESGDDLGYKDNPYTARRDAYGEIQDREKYSGDDEKGWWDDYFFEEVVYCKVQSGIIDVFINDTLA
jgi:hypothetical protein